MPDAGRVAATLAEWRETGQAASEGPWQPATAPNGGAVVETTWLVPEGYVGSGMTMRVAYLMGTAGKTEEEAANAEFIATARTAMPRLLTALEAAMELAGDWTVRRQSSRPRQGRIRVRPG